MPEQIDRRIKMEPIPGQLDNISNKLQMSAILQLESIGWRLWFVRRPLFQPVMPVAFVVKPAPASTSFLP